MLSVLYASDEQSSGGGGSPTGLVSGAGARLRCRIITTLPANDPGGRWRTPTELVKPTRSGHPLGALTSAARQPKLTFVALDVPGELQTAFPTGRMGLTNIFQPGSPVAPPLAWPAMTA